MKNRGEHGCTGSQVLLKMCYWPQNGNGRDSQHVKSTHCQTMNLDAFTWPWKNRFYHPLSKLTQRKHSLWRQHNIHRMKARLEQLGTRREAGDRISQWVTYWIGDTNHGHPPWNCADVWVCVLQKVCVSWNLFCVQAQWPRMWTPTRNLNLNIHWKTHSCRTPQARWVFAASGDWCRTMWPHSVIPLYSSVEMVPEDGTFLTAWVTVLFRENFHLASWYSPVCVCYVCVVSGLMWKHSVGLACGVISVSKTMSALTKWSEEEWK